MQVSRGWRRQMDSFGTWSCICLVFLSNCKVQMNEQNKSAIQGKLTNRPSKRVYPFVSNTFVLELQGLKALGWCAPDFPSAVIDAFTLKFINEQAINCFYITRRQAYVTQGEEERKRVTACYRFIIGNFHVLFLLPTRKGLLQLECRFFLVLDCLQMLRQTV